MTLVVKASARYRAGWRRKVIGGPRRILKAKHVRSAEQGAPAAMGLESALICGCPCRTNQKECVHPSTGLLLKHHVSR